MGFTHLEVHSHFTLLGATPPVDALADRAAEQGLTHLALTDTNALYGAVAFARACAAKRIQPVIGMTLTVAEPPGAGLMTAARRPGESSAGQLVLLATGPAGYRSLCRLSSAIQGSPDRDALAAAGLAWEAVAGHREGLICLSGGRMGWIERYVRAGDVAAAQLYAARLAGLFDENAYLALEIHDADDSAVAVEVSALGRRLGLPTVAVQPIYCLTPDDEPKLELLAAIRENRPLAESRGGDAGQDGSKRHWLTQDEITARFARFPDAIARAGEVAAKCSAALPGGEQVWPVLKLPTGETPQEALTELAEAGLSSRYPDESQDPQHDRRRAPTDVRARLEHELAAIGDEGYAPLFLIVADIVRFAREHSIPVSTRGSVANSLVAYCTGITTVDPIEHGLLFERFLNPARANPPDIDLDFCSRRRDEVLAYVRDTYGAEHTALIGTVSTMRPQSAVREAGKAYQLKEKEINWLADMMPHRWHPDPARRDRRTLDDVLKEIPDERQRMVVCAAYGIVGQPDHLSVHPGGAVITPGPLTDLVPVQWAPKGFLITQFEHGDVEAIGLPKIDLLGIRALTVLADAAALVIAHRDPAFRLDNIPLDDATTAGILRRGETIGVFQCESDGAQRTLRKLQAHTVRDLAIANAFFKPGPAMGGNTKVFVERYRGRQAVEYLHPALKPILGPTKGVLIFQEQVLRIAVEVAGLSWAQADQIRRGMSHFGADQMAAVREQFVTGCMRKPPGGPGMTQDQAGRLWEQIMPFAGYGFNQGHATAYADVSFRSAYLKAHYPAEFLAARLADHGGFHHPAIYMAEAVRLGIPVLPPHVNYSGEAFTLHTGQDGERPRLYMGLGQVRDLRRSSIDAIVAARQRRPFDGLRDLLCRVELQQKEIDHLIRCGGLDGLGESRADLLAGADQIRRGGGAGQLAFDFASPEVAAESLNERMTWETELLGLPVSVHPLAALEEQSPGVLPAHIPLRRLVEQSSQARLAEHARQSVTVAGVRLPGWTGGPGFILGDEECFVQVRAPESVKAPPPWQPVVVRGRWASDEYGSQWFQAEQLLVL
jgi:DNA polymerase III subunit alpha